MSKDIKTLGAKFKSTGALEQSNLKLKEENVALQATVTKLLKKIEEMMDIDPDNIIQMGYSPEQEIVEVQITRLQAVSRTRSLSLDETRTLDLHLKNKRMIDIEIKDALEAEYEDLSNDDLMRLASGGQEQEIIEVGEGETSPAETSEESALEEGDTSLETT